MNCIKKIICGFLVILLMCLVAGCGANDNQDSGIPLPPFAKQVSKNTIEIPFPHNYKFSNGLERVMLQRANSPDNLEFSIIWQEGGQECSFPIGKVGAGTYNINDSIKLSGVNYKTISITINKDLDSGFIKLVKVK